MAAIQCRNGSYRILFRHAGKQHAFTLGEVSEEEAESKAAQVDYLLLRLKQRLAVLPPGVEIVEYIEFDGKIIPPESPAAEKITLPTLRDRYIETHTASLEPNTMQLIRIHFGHLVGILGEEFCVSDTQLVDLQRYVDKRAKAKGLHGRKLSATTIGKEIATLNGAWTWGVKMKLPTGPFPGDGLRYPKTVEKSAFMTRTEIERRIKAGGLTPAEIADLWESYYLTIDEVTEFLSHVKAKATQPWVYPMVCFAAHTGARRSEMLRLKVTDLDFAGQTAIIQEKKKVKGRTTTRRVPLSAFLISVLKDWLKIHPGCAYHLPLDHSFADVSEADGKFEIKDLPVGTHEFKVWHEVGKMLEKSLVVNIKPGDNEITIKIPAVKLMSAVKREETMDREAFQGTWLPATAELAGKPFPDQVRKTMKLVIKDGTYTVTVGKSIDRGTLTLDPLAKPKALDITGTEGPNNGNITPTIYELSGETLRICYDLSGKRRPTEFKTEEGTQLFLVLYKRERP